MLHICLQIFSVRMRESGPDYRGFVQILPDPLESLTSEHEGVLTTEMSALCFVDTCQQSFDASISKCHVSILIFF